MEQIPGADDYFQAIKKMMKATIFTWVLIILLPDMGLLLSVLGLFLFQCDMNKMIFTHEQGDSLSGMEICFWMMAFFVVLFVFQGPGVARMIATIVIAGFFPVTGAFLLAPIISICRLYRKRNNITTRDEFIKAKRLLDQHVLTMSLFSVILAFESLMMRTHFNYKLFEDAVLLPPFVLGALLLLTFPYACFVVLLPSLQNLK